MVAVAAWVVTVCLLVTAWAVFLGTEQWRTAIMLGISSAIAASAATVSQIRVYALKTSELIRLASGIHQGDSGEVVGLRSLP